MTCKTCDKFETVRCPTRQITTAGEWARIEVEVWDCCCVYEEAYDYDKAA